MPPKRRGAENHRLVQPPPLPPPPPPPPPPPESDATKVRKEWSKFLDAWYEPQKKKLVEKLQKDLLVKYKNLGPAKDTQKLREMELFEKLDVIAQQLAQPARAEWERRLELAHLREDQWDDMSGEEQQLVMSVFVGFFTDDVEDMHNDDLSPEPSSEEEDEERVPDDPPFRGMPSFPPSLPTKQPIPPTPTRQTFEFVHPTTFFLDSVTPPVPAKNLPALSMDHLATLGPSNPTRSAEPVSASINGVLGFHNWASEVGIVTPIPQPAKSPVVHPGSSLAPLTARPRATDAISRQTSLASTSNSPPLKPPSPQYSPLIPSTKFSPPINTENLALGKRYIGPVIWEEDPDPMEEDLLKSRMADEYQQYKISLRIQMIYQFHAEAAEVEIKLVESLLADEGTKESRARAVQEHETSMMRLRELKEEERKRLCADERERRRQEMRHHLAQRRHREVDLVPKANLPKSFPDKTSVQPRPAKITHQKENVPLSHSLPPSASKLELPSPIKKSNSTLSQGEASANEALFANAMAMMTQEKASASVLTSAQASLNEALFSNAAAALASSGHPATTSKNAVQPPSIMKKSNSARSQECDVPQITVSFADPPAVVLPEPAPVPPATIKGKKGKKGQSAVQLPPAKPVAVTEEPEVEMDAEPPPGPSLWDAAAGTAKSVWGAASASLAAPKFTTPVEEERVPEPTPMTAPAPSKGNPNTKKSTPAAKKGKKVTIIEEPDVDADPIISPPPTAKPKATKGGWGSVNAKSKVTPFLAEEDEPDQPPPPARGKKAAMASTAKSSQKPQLKVAISDEHESELEPNPVPARANKVKSAWDLPTATPSVPPSSQSAKKATQALPRHSATGPGSRSVRVDTVPDLKDKRPDVTATESTMPGTLSSAAPVGTEDDDEGDASAWFNPENLSYWAEFMAGPSEEEAEAGTKTQAPAQATPPATEQTGKHVLWTPTQSGESDDEEELGEADQMLATSVWMQYAISGGDIPTLSGAPDEPPVMPSKMVQRDASPWEQGRGKKPLNPTIGDFGSRVQQTSVFDRAALTGQWPKMDNWLSPPPRGQNSGTRVF